MPKMPPVRHKNLDSTWIQFKLQAHTIFNGIITLAFLLLTNLKYPSLICLLVCLFISLRYPLSTPRLIVTSLKSLALLLALNV